MNLQGLNGGSVGLLVIGPRPEVRLLAGALHDEIGPGHGRADDVDGDAEHSISFLRLSHDGSVPPLLIDGARVGR